MKPKKKVDGWYVVDDNGDDLAGPLGSEEETRSWIRRHSDDEGSAPPPTRPKMK